MVYYLPYLDNLKLRSLLSISFSPTIDPSTSFNDNHSHTMPKKSLLSYPAIPEDLWIDCLIHLSYFDLLRLERFNLAFRNMLKTPILARRHFRVEATQLKKGQQLSAEFAIHPVLSLVACLAEVPFKKLVARKSQDRLTKIAARSEMLAI